MNHGWHNSLGRIYQLLLLSSLWLFGISDASADFFDAGLTDPIKSGTARQRAKPISVTLSYKLAPSYVDHSPDGEIDPVELKRFEGSSLSTIVPVRSGLVLEAELFKKNMASKRHQYDLENGRLQMHLALPYSWRKFALGMTLGLWGNTTDTVQKNTSIKFDDFRFSKLLIHAPQDQQMDFSLHTYRNLFSNTLWYGTIGYGISKVTFSRVTGQYERGECSYSFDVTHHEGSTVQLGGCGVLTAAEIYMPSDEALLENIGFLPADDLNYRSDYWLAGTGFRYNTSRWYSELGYRWQKMNRGSIEERTAELDNQNFTVSHALNWSLGYRVYRHFEILGSLEYENHRLLSSQPLVYNPYTSDNFEKPGVFISLGMRVLL